jgi:hypothetical protein
LLAGAVNGEHDVEIDLGNEQLPMAVTFTFEELKAANRRAQEKNKPTGRPSVGTGLSPLEVGAQRAAPLRASAPLDLGRHGRGETRPI